ncbi:MAG: glucosylceramidase [Myxococcota bacterium]|jgi:glucosylceramidase
MSIYTTACNTELRLTQTGTLASTPATQPVESDIAIFVDARRAFQTFIGVGGAITDAAAEVFATLPPPRQAEFLRAYYDPDGGIGYSLLRTTIHSCDFSPHSYTYVSDEDPALSTFDIAPDRRLRLPMIKRAIAAAGGALLTYASPWSPPPFMKDTRRMLEGGSLLPEHYPTWARYFTRFIDAYEREGVPIWGVTIQNEPMAVQRWESCIYTAEQERDFLRDHLGPAMAEAGYSDRKIVVWDHNRDLICHRAHTIFSDPEAARYAWGTGFHWYETWAGGRPLFDNLARVREAYPDKQLLFTEGCVEGFDPDRLQSWANAERYGRSMINDFNAGTAGWTDWNILLDHSGGPNHVGNHCFAPIHADADAQCLVYTPSYYYIGHFSKFVRPGARRVSCASSHSHLLSTAFRNPDGSLATIVMNPTGQPISYQLFTGTRAAAVTIPPRAMQTLITR